MKKIRGFPSLFLHILFLLHLNFGSEVAAAGRVSVIEAVVVKAKYIADVESRFAGDVPMGSYFDVTVSQPRAIVGKVPPGLKVLRLMASHLHYFKRGTKISVYLEFGEDNSVLATAWENVRSVTCFDKEVWERGAIADQWHYIETSTAYGTRYCVYVD